MNLKLNSSELCLAHNVPVRLPFAKGTRVICVEGVLWLTVSGEAGDVFLRPGEVYAIHGRGPAVLEAIGGGRARLERKVPWWRFQRVRTLLALARGKEATRLVSA
ncbi:MAG: DUF2917 domain-containing protein [Dokdonella sp.]|nr:MAG: DUF2917 domain-containing protein [Dokdonella sp.]